MYIYIYILYIMYIYIYYIYILYVIYIYYLYNGFFQEINLALEPRLQRSLFRTVTARIQCSPRWWDST